MIPPLLRLPMLRLLRSARFYFALALGLGATLLLAFMFRHRAHGADSALLGPSSSIVLPLLVYSVTGAVLGEGSLQGAVEPLVLFGASRRLSVLATLFTATVGSAIVGGLLPIVALLVAHGAADPPLLRDLLVSVRVASLAAAAMAAVACFGSLFGRNGGGRAVLFFLLWAIGGGESGIAVLSPSAHLRGLLGGVPPIDISARSSQIVLLAMLATLVGGAVLRAARPQRERAPT